MNDESFKFFLFIQLIDNIFVEFFSFVSLNFHCVSQNAFVHERLTLEVNISSLFEPFEASFLASVVDLLQDFKSDLFVLAQFVEFAFDFLISSDFHEFLFVGHDDGNAERLGGLAVQEDFVDKIALGIQIFHFFSCDVFALLELKNILLSIDDFQAFSIC